MDKNQQQIINTLENSREEYSNLIKKKHRFCLSYFIFTLIKYISSFMVILFGLQLIVEMVKPYLVNSSENIIVTSLTTVTETYTVLFNIITDLIPYANAVDTFSSLIILLTVFFGSIILSFFTNFIRRRRTERRLLSKSYLELLVKNYYIPSINEVFGTNINVNVKKYNFNLNFLLNMKTVNINIDPKTIKIIVKEGIYQRIEKESFVNNHWINDLEELPLVEHVEVKLLKHQFELEISLSEPFIENNLDKTLLGNKSKRNNFLLEPRKYLLKDLFSIINKITKQYF